MGRAILENDNKKSAVSVLKFLPKIIGGPEIGGF